MSNMLKKTINLMQLKTIKTRKKLRRQSKNQSKRVNKKTQVLLLNLLFRRNRIQKMIKPKFKTKVNNHRKKLKKVPKCKSNQNSKLLIINHNQMINRLQKIKKVKKRLNRMIKRNELKSERGVKIRNKKRKEVPIIAGPSRIMHKGSILSYRGREEAKSRSKSKMKRMIIKEGSKQPINQAIRPIIPGKDQKLTLIDLLRLLPKAPLREVNPGTSMHHKPINQNQCPSMLMHLNFCIRKSRRASKIRWQHINYRSRLKENRKRTQIQSRRSRKKSRDQYTHSNSFSVLNYKTNRDLQTCQNLIFLTKSVDPI